MDLKKLALMTGIPVTVLAAAIGAYLSFGGDTIEEIQAPTPAPVVKSVEPPTPTVSMPTIPPSPTAVPTVAPTSTPVPIVAMPPMPTVRPTQPPPVTEPTVTPPMPEKLPEMAPVRQEWHSQIHRKTAEQDGLTPADFTWLEYPVSNVRIEPNPSRHVDLNYLADIPADTPQVNVYIEEKDWQEGVVYEDAGAPGWLKIPDPVGTALAWVRFNLIDVEDGAELHNSSAPNHVNGVAQGGLSASARGIPLWERLAPGGSIQVQLEAFPRFFPYNKDGDGGNQYSVGGRGYLWGETVTSPVYTLSMTEDGELLIDGP